MNWSQAKTILIITFLLLNAFLIIQIQDLNDAHQINVIAEATIQERLNEMNVEISVPYQDDHLSGYHILGRNKTIQKEDLQSLVNQDITIVNDNMILSKLNKPFELKEGEIINQMTQFLSTHVYNGKLYQFAGYDTDNNQVLFLQTYQNKVMYPYDEPPLIVKLDSQNRIVSYQQNILEIDEQGREQEFLTSMKAIEILLNEQLIKANQKVEAIEFGYYSFFKPQTEVQVFAPMWRITVNGDNFLVNAIDGSVQDIN